MFLSLFPFIVYATFKLVCAVYFNVSNMATARIKSVRSGRPCYEGHCAGCKQYLHSVHRGPFFLCSHKHTQLVSAHHVSFVRPQSNRTVPNPRRITKIALFKKQTLALSRNFKSILIIYTLINGCNSELQAHSTP